MELDLSLFSFLPSSWEAGSAPQSSKRPSALILDKLVSVFQYDSLTKVKQGLMNQGFLRQFFPIFFGIARKFGANSSRLYFEKPEQSLSILALPNCISIVIPETSVTSVTNIQSVITYFWPKVNKSVDLRSKK